MNLRDVDAALLRRAVSLYRSEAYGEAPPRRKLPDLAGARTLEEALTLFEDESRRHEGARPVRRWVLRLGNPRYPNMKLVLEEYLLAGEFVFTVDTHDAAVVLPGAPDEPAWRELRAWNLALKRRIEARWREGGVPTYATLRERLAGAAPRRAGPPRGTILVVDDEGDIADTVEAVLVGEGFRVRKARDGAEALQRVREEIPDLILMDYDMPRLSGIEACARLRRSRRSRDIPVLLATASMVDLSAFSDADGFLVKPYQKDVLVQFVTHLARRKPAAGGAPARAAARRAPPRGARGPIRRAPGRAPLASGVRPRPPGEEEE